MPRKCQLTGRRKLRGNLVSHSKIKTTVFKEINIKSKRYFVDRFNECVSLKLTTRAIRTIDKFGTLEEFLRRTPNAELTESLLKLKIRIFK